MTNETLRMFNSKNCVKCLGGASIGHVPLIRVVGRFENPRGAGVVMWCPPPLIMIWLTDLPNFGGRKGNCPPWPPVLSALLIRDMSMVMDYLLKVLRLILSQEGL